MIRSSAVWLLFAAAAYAQQPPQPATVSGSVANSVTGEALARVHVSLRMPARAWGAVTDADGKFSIASLPPGSYTVQMERTGFRMVRHYGFGDDPSQIEVAPGEKKDVKLTLAPSGAISGRVFDAAGEPMEHVGVTVEGGWNGIPVVWTDEQGRFRVSGLAAGKYRVRAAPMVLPMPPEHRSDGTEEVHHSETYYPGSLTVSGAERVSVKPGVESNGIDIHLIRTPIVRVSGVVVGFPKTSDVRFRIDHEGGNSGSGANPRPDGHFEIWRLDPGKYSISARLERESGAIVSAPVEIVVADRNIDGLVLRAVAPSNIPGSVTYEDESARPGKAASIVLKPAASTSGEGTVSQADIESDGTFLLENVPPGRYVVSPSWPSAYVKSMTIGATRIDGPLLDLSGGLGEGASLSVALSADVAEISGTVRDDKGPVSAFAVLAPETEDGSEVQMAMGPTGQYTFSGIVPGNYKLFALPQADGINIRAIARDLEDYEDVVEHIMVGPRDKITKDLKLKAPEE